MSQSRSLSRRAALAGLGAGGLGFAFASQAATSRQPTRDPGVVNGVFDLADHPLSGLWLAMVELPSGPGITVAVPSLFAADGSAVLMFPPCEAIEDGAHLKGPAIGTWEATDDHSGHFTAVQVLADVQGAYRGTLTIDGHPSVNDDFISFEDKGDRGALTVRDAANLIVSSLPGFSVGPMKARRMLPGVPGFPDTPDRRGPDPRTMARMESDDA